LTFEEDEIKPTKEKLVKTQKIEFSTKEKNAVDIMIGLNSS
jgi:hypothetical protein